jgi:hypothetical protein
MATILACGIHPGRSCFGWSGRGFAFLFTLKIVVLLCAGCGMGELRSAWTGESPVPILAKQKPPVFTDG